jgi:hypothetical protein
MSLRDQILMNIVSYKSNIRSIKLYMYPMNIIFPHRDILANFLDFSRERDIVYTVI